MYIYFYTSYLVNSKLIISLEAQEIRDFLHLKFQEGV